jgi:cell division protein FtsB
MKWLAAALLTAILLLQYRLWLSNDGVAEVLRLRSAVATRQAENARVSERNRQLAAEVRDLKQGYTALEERARSDLGMIAGNESFYQVVPQKGAGSAAAPMPPTPALRSPQRTAAAR